MQEKFFLKHVGVFLCFFFALAGVGQCIEH